MKLLSIFVALCFFYSKLHAQSEMRVIGSGERIPGFIIANEKQNLDVNNQLVGLIVFETDLTGLQFEADAKRMVSNPGEYMLFLSPGTRRVRVLSLAHMPLDIILSEVGIRIKSGDSWRLKITGDKKMEILPINFQIQPSDASLVIDGNKQTGLNNLPFAIGNHIVEISKTGYKSIVDTIEVSASQSLFSFSMTRVQQVGLTITSQPPDAKVFIDEVEFGLTPQSMFRFPGKFKLRIEKTGYITHEETAELLEGAKTLVKEVNLMKDAGTIILKKTPPDAEVLINNIPQSGSSFELLPGRYRVRVSKPGWLSEERTLDVYLGKTVSESFELIKNMASISWTVNPTQAVVSINQKINVGGNLELPPGEHLIEITAEGYDPITENIVLSRGEVVERNWSLLRIEGSFRYLSNPADANAQLFHKGTLIDSWNGLKVAENVPVGEYEIRTRIKGYQTKITKLKIERNQESDVNVFLDKLPPAELLAIKKGPEAALRSLLVPGWGVNAVTGGEKNGARRTLLVAGLFGSAFLMELQSKNQFEKYLAETEKAKIEALYERANSFRLGAVALAGAAGFVWAYDVFWVLNHGSKNAILKRKLKNDQAFLIQFQPSHQNLVMRYEF